MINCQFANLEMKIFVNLYKVKYMDIHLKKIEIIHWLTEITERNVIDEILAVKSKFSTTYDEHIIGALLDQGEDDIINGHVLSNEQVMHEMREKYGIKS